MCCGHVRFALNGALVMLARPAQGRCAALRPGGACLKIGVDRQRIERSTMGKAGCDLAAQDQFECLGHGTRNFALHLHRLCKGAIEGLRPQLESGGAVHQLHADVNLVAVAAHAAIEQVTHGKCMGNGSHVFVSLSKREHRRTRGYAQSWQASQCFQQAFGKSIGQVEVCRITDCVFEWQYSDRAFTWFAREQFPFDDTRGDEIRSRGDGRDGGNDQSPGAPTRWWRCDVCFRARNAWLRTGC
jgi:hypothetical protein